MWKKVLGHALIVLGILPLTVFICAYLIVVFHPPVVVQMVAFFGSVILGSFISGVYTTLFVEDLTKEKGVKNELPNSEG